MKIPRSILSRLHFQNGAGIRIGYKKLQNEVNDLNVFEILRFISRCASTTSTSHC